jgi:hypothetical protein
MVSNELDNDESNEHNEKMGNEKNENREHAAREIVGDKDCNGWTVEWWKWLLSKSDEESPFTVFGHAGPDRYVAGQPNEVQRRSMKEYGRSVWFLCPSPYSGDKMIGINIPKGTWSILATPYVAVASNEAYPSLKTTAQLRKHVEDDVAGLYDLWAKLDGTSLNGCVVKMTDMPFNIDNVPIRNMLGMDEETVRQKQGKIKMVQYGHWIWLKPLSPGDHLLHLHGFSKNYELDVKFQLNVTGPQ